MQELDEYIDKVRHLPPAPRVVPELLALLKEPDIHSERVVDMISLDPSLTASVLQLCNSAYYGFALPVVDLQEAITRLGLQQVYQMVAAISGSKVLSPSQNGYGID